MDFWNHQTHRRSRSGSKVAIIPSGSNNNTYDTVTLNKIPAIPSMTIKRQKSIDLEDNIPNITAQSLCTGILKNSVLPSKDDIDTNRDSSKYSPKSTMKAPSLLIPLSCEHSENKSKSNFINNKKKYKHFERQHHFSFNSDNDTYLYDETTNNNQYITNSSISTNENIENNIKEDINAFNKDFFTLENLEQQQKQLSPIHYHNNKKKNKFMVANIKTKTVPLEKISRIRPTPITDLDHVVFFNHGPCRSSQ